MTGVEDLRTERIETGHGEVRRRVVGLLNDLGDLAEAVGVTDPVSGSLLPGYFLNEERSVRTVLLLAPNDDVKGADLAWVDVHSVDERTAVTTARIADEIAPGGLYLDGPTR